MRVLITGGSSGIGAAVLEKLGALGHEAVALDIARPVAKCDWIETDLGSQQAITAALNQVVGSFDAVINNAGLPPRDGLEDTILRVNFFGLRQVTEALLERIKPGGAIVNVASRAGAAWRENIEQVKALMTLKPDGLPDFISENQLDPVRAYNLSKEAVIAYGLSQTEALIARNLRMNSVSPAAVSTAILEDFTAAFGDRVTRNIARAARPGTPDEIADVILFLASPQSGWIKGQDITIDGGMSAMGMSDALGL